MGLRDPQGRATPALARELKRIEREREFTPRGRLEFQTLLGRVGVKSSQPVAIPTDDQPFWFRFEHPLKQYRSRPELPAEADVVIIGAGLTGASAAYHLREAAASGLRVVVLEKGSPGCEASGRNAGNFELLPENSVGVYDGLPRERLAFLRRCYPWVPVELLKIEAERQASLLLGFALRNRELLKSIVEQEKIDCDFSPRGWLYLAHTKREEQAIRDEVSLAAGQDQRIEVWPRQKIREEFGFERQFIGRFIPEDGTYHPYKFVYGVLDLAVRAGVELYTGVSVREVHTEAGRESVRTDHGTIAAPKVIVATNAFTSRLFPELSAIRPAQSQICVTEFAPDRCRGRVVTSEEGPVYFNQPRASAANGIGPLLLGGGKDRPMKNPWSRRRSAHVHEELVALRDRFFPELSKQPFSTEWVGPIAFTSDQVPAIGFLRPEVIIAAGFNGYGGSYCCAAGHAAAWMARAGKPPEWLPEDIFSPKRLLERQPIFISETDSLWTFAASLCVQLRSVYAQIREATGMNVTESEIPRTSPEAVSWPLHAQPATVTMDMLTSLHCFRAFTRSELEQVLTLGRAWKAPKGTVVFSEGSNGDSCFVVVRGAVNASIQTGAREQLLARLGAGRFFGEDALIEGGKRTSTCSIHTDAVLLEIMRGPCDALFARPSALAFKFLSTLTQRLVDELRGANRRLIRLARQNRIRWGRVDPTVKGRAQSAKSGRA